MSSIMTKQWGLVDLENPSLDRVSHYKLLEGLSRVHRFNGAGGSEFSVLRHSYFMLECARKLDANLPTRKWCILHDAHELVIGDMQSPIKDLLGVAANTRLSTLANKLDIQFAAHYGVDLDEVDFNLVAYLDRLSLSYEMRLVYKTALTYPEFDTPDWFPALGIMLRVLEMKAVDIEGQAAAVLRTPA